MIAGRIEGATHYLGKPAGWNPSDANTCESLAVLHTEVGGLPVMLSSWTPTPRELESLNSGSPVYLTVVGRVHPPVMLTVGPEPERS